LSRPKTEEIYFHMIQRKPGDWVGHALLDIGRTVELEFYAEAPSEQRCWEELFTGLSIKDKLLSKIEQMDRQ